jgi:hypothetical protein
MANSESTKNRELRTRIEQWLRPEYDTVQPFTADSMAWSYIASFSNGRKLLVGRPLEFESHLQISSGLTLAEPHREKFALLPREQRTAYFYDTASQLLALDVQYEGLVDPPREIWVHTKCFIDGLTRDAFFQRTLRIGNIIMLLGLGLSRLLGEGFNRGSSSQEDVN